MEEDKGPKQNVLNSLLWSLEFQHHSILYFAQNEKFIVLDALGLANIDKML